MSKDEAEFPVEPTFPGGVSSRPCNNNNNDNNKFASARRQQQQQQQQQEVP
jgi:hypothetical protein